MLMGESTRLEDKPFLKIDGRELFLYGHERLREIFDRVLIVCDEGLASKLKNHKVGFISENHKVGPLGGIVEGMKSLSEDYVFVVGCDMPFLNRKVIMHLWEKVSGDGIVPKHDDGKLEPLHSFLRREKVLDIGILDEHRITNLLQKMDIKFEPVENLRKYDEELLTFKNINTQENVEWMKNYI